MSAFRPSRTGLYLSMYSRIQELTFRYSPGLSCGSCKYSSRPMFQGFSTPGFLFFGLDRQHRRTCIRPRSSTSELPCFQDVMRFRQKQAQQSVLIELSSKKDIPCVLNLCKHYGKIKNMIAFLSKYHKFQVIAEFVHEESVQKLLSDCSLKDVVETFPCQSRFLHFENKGKQHTDITSGEVIDLTVEANSSGNKEPLSVSEMMVELYEKERMSDLSTRQRFLSCAMLQDALSGMYPHCTAFPFGSSVNGFGKDSSDLDLMLRLFPEHVTKNPELFFHAKGVNGNCREVQRRAVFALSDILQIFVPGVSHVKRIPNARVPIVEYHHNVLSLECDVSINNMPAVYMSEILFFCGELDPRIRPLMYTVKKWAKEADLTYDFPGSRITNFTLTLLVLYFLQSCRVPILSPLEKLIGLPLADDYKSCAVKYLNKGGSRNLKPAAMNQKSESLEDLLQEFLNFLAVFPFETKRLSVIAGVECSRTDGHAMWIDYPLDESFNIAKNISEDELQKVCRSAAAAAKNLEKNSHTNEGTTDLMSVLGVASLKQHDSSRIDVRAFLEETTQQKVIRGVR